MDSELLFIKLKVIFNDLYFDAVPKKDILMKLIDIMDYIETTGIKEVDKNEH